MRVPYWAKISGERLQDHWSSGINFCSPFPRRLHMKFGFDWPNGFRGEDI